jgi:hypothetical protein
VYSYICSVQNVATKSSDTVQQKYLLLIVGGAAQACIQQYEYANHTCDVSVLIAFSDSKLHTCWTH